MLIRSALSFIICVYRGKEESWRLKERDLKKEQVNEIMKLKLDTRDKHEILCAPHRYIEYYVKIPCGTFLFGCSYTKFALVC